MKQKIKNPLLRRIPRELLGDWRKYLVVSLFLILTIGFVSGMYVANESMLSAADKGSDIYKLEDGHFELSEKADEKLLSAIASGEKADVKEYYLESAKNETAVAAMLFSAVEQAKQSEAYTEAYDAAYIEAYSSAYDEAYKASYDDAWNEILEEIDRKYADAEEKYQLNDPEFGSVPTKIYENFYRNEEEDNNNDGTTDGTVRVFTKTDSINLACLMDGRFPESADEIAVDRMHANNVGIKVGEIITIGKKTWKVVGLIAYVNYSTLHEKNTDLMFDALKFNVAMVTEEGFSSLEKSIHYAYAWKYENSPENETEEKKLADNFLKTVLTQAVVNENEIEDYLPAYANQAIHFATDDMGSDKAMGGVLLDILIVIIAFIFAVTISNTIAKESKTIGTLRASGYTRGELLRPR